jgi:hypothetical protein
MSTGKRLEEFPSKYEDLGNNASSKLQRDFFLRARKPDCLCRNIVVHIAFNGNAHSSGAYIYIDISLRKQVGPTKGAELTCSFA